MGFEDSCCELSSTALWKLLKDKARKEKLPDEFADSVGKICKHGVTLAKDIIRFFPTFTLHDVTHIRNVCDWIVRLLGDKKKDLSATEAALLMLSASCHDIGMSVSVLQKNELLANTDTLEWREYFKTHLKDEEEFCITGKISEQMLRSYVRLNHNKRIAEQFDTVDWPAELSNQGIDCETVIRLCSSHGEPIDELTVSEYEVYTDKYDFRLCAILLRLADILDFDASRAPVTLYYHLGLAEPATAEAAYSQTEWDKNCTPHNFDRITNGVLPFKAVCTSMQVEHEVRVYMDWVRQELDSCNKYLVHCSGRWATFHLPHKLSVTITPNGYKSGDFRLTMDQDRILELLVGRNLYSDPGVFVRELLQNAIDAVRTRGALDPYFDSKDSKIVIRTWMGDDGRSWFRIEDNGIGMDEAVITNYFLKVGRSYYASDDFKADKRRYGQGKDYTPISRFGIGILSCFMSDPKHNMLEVSTRRFSRDPDKRQPAVRLNVTGLHGYYYLAKEGEQRTGAAFQPMHHPQNKDKAYRRDVGTTICVCIDLYQLGDYRSFKDIVDRYVQFPEIPVEYYGPEGYMHYPTESELMDTVHKLNPDGLGKPPKEYIHSLPDELMEEVKQKAFGVSWTEDPTVAIQYYPLDWISTSGKINGIAIFAKLKGAGFSNSIQYKGEHVTPELVFKLDNNSAKCGIDLTFYHRFSFEFEQKMRAIDSDFPSYNSFEREILHYYNRYHTDPSWCAYIAQKYNINTAEIHREYQRLQQFGEIYRDQRLTLEQYKQLNWRYFQTVSYDDILKQSDTLEADVFRFIKGRIRGANTITAYNGILADTNDLLGEGTHCLGTLFLLKGDYRPEVSLARDTISALPLEAVCDLSLLRQSLPDMAYLQRNVSTPLQNRQFALLSEHELVDLLNSHTDWTTKVVINLDFYSSTHYSIIELHQMLQNQCEVKLSHFDKHSFYDVLCLAVLKQRYSVYMDFSDCDRLLYSPYVMDIPPDNNIAAFPPFLFFSPTKPDGRLAYIAGKEVFEQSFNYFNQEHPFSLWLIQHHEQLQELVPILYKSMLEVMILGDDASEIQAGINAILRRLREYHHNMFAISDELFLSKDDFL